MAWPALSVRFWPGCFSSLPKDLDDAATIDGAFHLQILSKIFLPVAMLGITAANALFPLPRKIFRRRDSGRQREEAFEIARRNKPR